MDKKINSDLEFVTEVANTVKVLNEYRSRFNVTEDVAELEHENANRAVAAIADVLEDVGNAVHMRSVMGDEDEIDCEMLNEALEGTPFHKYRFIFVGGSCNGPPLELVAPS